MATNQLPVCLLVKDGYFVHHTAVRDQRLDNVLQLEVGCWDKLVNNTAHCQIP